jgi:alpha-glucosidase
MRANAGFTTGEPWLPVGDDVEGCNVEVQRKDARSLLTSYRSLLGFRGNAPALRAGSYEPFEGSAEILAYCRCLDGRRIFVALNFADAGEEVALPGPGQIPVSTHFGRAEERVEGSVRLQPHEGIILEIRGCKSRVGS